MKRVGLSRTIMLFLFGIIFFFLFTSLWAFFLYLKPSKIVSAITPEDLGLPYEEVSFTTKDNLTLRGWFIPRQGSLRVRASESRTGQVPRPFNKAQGKQPKTIIALHGWPADKGNILPVVSFLTQTYNLFLFDFRALGESEGRYCTIGAKETEDLLAAIRYLKSQGIEEVGVWGFSMGGAVALMTAPQAPEIKAVVSESSYARLDLMASEAFRLPFLRHPLGFVTGLWAKVILGINLRDVAPVESAKQLRIPVLITHSSTDDVIPFSHAQLLKDALKNNPKAEFWFLENLLHGQLTQEHRQRITDFFTRNL